MLASTKILKWQYNGVAPFQEIVEWCCITMGIPYSGRWSWDFETIYFDRDEDYAMFLLRWS